MYASSLANGCTINGRKGFWFDGPADFPLPKAQLPYNKPSNQYGGYRKKGTLALKNLGVQNDKNGSDAQHQRLVDIIWLM